MQTLVQDIRFGVRMLVKNPGITIIAIVTLALGIGANTAIFSAVNGLLLRPLPVQNADRLTVIAGQVKGIDGGGPLSYLEYRDLREQAHGFSDILGFDLNGVGMEVDGKTEALLVSYVTGNYFTGLGLQPAYGRLFSGENGEARERAGVGAGSCLLEEAFQFRSRRDRQTGQAQRQSGDDRGSSARGFQRHLLAG
jgi:putative ABC transport system permease protein